MLCIPARRGFGLEQGKYAIINQMEGRVGFVWGPSDFARENVGSIIYSAEDRWGEQAVVLMDDESKGDCGPFRSVSSFTNVGIGAHLLRG